MVPAIGARASAKRLSCTAGARGRCVVLMLAGADLVTGRTCGTRRHLAAGRAWWSVFTAFNILEATLPSMVSKFAPEAHRGAALGVYSTSQFIGAFLGGVVGGAVVRQPTAAEGVFTGLRPGGGGVVPGGRGAARATVGGPDIRRVTARNIAAAQARRRRARPGQFRRPRLRRDRGPVMSGSHRAPWRGAQGAATSVPRPAAATEKQRATDYPSWDLNASASSATSSCCSTAASRRWRGS
ncbi:MAG: hypothetical protein U5L11_00550 [Arhodomonas sp.]|nr:hypothetical protein [Arhodomonas sp.]